MTHAGYCSYMYCVMQYCTTGNGGFNKGWIKEVEFFYESEPRKKTLSKGQELKSEKATIVEIRVKIHPKQKM